jgi:hypothetical protein
MNHPSLAFQKGMVTIHPPLASFVQRSMATRLSVYRRTIA